MLTNQDQTRRTFLKTAGLGASAAVFAGCCRLSAEPSSPAKPNIMLVFAEDISTELGCYNFPAARTPNLDAFAKQGCRYTHVFTTAPTCSPSRSAMATGAYQTRIGAHDQRMRDQWSQDKDHSLPRPHRLMTDDLRQAGYYIAFGCGYNPKIDYNFNTDSPLFDSKDWSGRAPGQPFFAQITLALTHRMTYNGTPTSVTRPTDPDDVVLPPYHPDHPVVRRDWAEYLDRMQMVDQQFGRLMERVDAEGLRDNTLVIFMGDNGISQIRGKCWLYDPGILVPMMIRWPDRIKPGTVCDDLISGVDIPAAILDAAGVPVPEAMDGISFFDPDAEKRDCIFAARDRIDEAVDVIRCVRDRRYKYIRNYMPEVPRTQKFAHIEEYYPVLGVLKELYAAGKLTPAQELFMQTPKPREELFDLENDPYELNNLAGSARYADVLARMRARLDQWIRQTQDTGLKERISQQE